MVGRHDLEAFHRDRADTADGVRALRQARGGADLLTVFGLVAGAWVDRVRRRPLLVAADLLRAAVIGSVPLAYSAHILSMALLYAVSLAAWGPIPISALIAGTLASATSTRAVLVVAAAGAIAAVTPVGLWRAGGARD